MKSSVLPGRLSAYTWYHIYVINQCISPSISSLPSPFPFPFPFPPVPSLPFTPLPSPSLPFPSLPFPYLSLPSSPFSFLPSPPFKEVPLAFRSTRASSKLPKSSMMSSSQPMMPSWLLSLTSTLVSAGVSIYPQCYSQYSNTSHNTHSNTNITPYSWYSYSSIDKHAIVLSIIIQTQP